MKLKSNKKASENWAPDTMPFFIMFVIVLGFSLLIFFIIISYFISKDIEIPTDVEGFILIERFYNSADCFAYKDQETGRIYQKTIDLIKFKNSDIMETCLPVSNLNHAFKLELEDPESSSKLLITTPNWIANSNFRTIQKDVFVYFNDKVKSEKLHISIQNA